MKEIEDILSGINNGNALLFAGAGFSKECRNVSSEKLLLGSELARELAKLLGIKESSKLSYVADKFFTACDNGEKNIEELISFMKSKFTVSVVSDSVKNICSVPWDIYYTTNYDNSIEKAVDGVVSVDMDSDDTYELRDRRCVHINGFIENITQENINKTFKLSETSYMIEDGFLKSTWFTVFKRDLERATVVVFIGYSLYDFDIKRLIYSCANKNKVYFVVKSDCSEEEEYELLKFGKVLKIGVEGFADELHRNMHKIKARKSMILSSVKEYKYENSNIDVSDNDVEKLLMLGKCNNGILENDILEKGNNYIVYRDIIDNILEVIKKNNVIITGDMGNGKSIILRSCLPVLKKEFSNVFIIDDPYKDYISDVESISSEADGKVVFVIDDYGDYIRLFEYLRAFKCDNIRFLLTARTSRHERIKIKLEEFNVPYNIISIDFLKDNESECIANIIDSIGFWGDKYITKRDKVTFINNKCKRQMSVLLLDILDSPHIKEKLKNIVDNLLCSNDELKRVTVIALFLCMLDIKVDTALVSHFAGSVAYSSNVINNENFIDIFRVDRSLFMSKSSIFCQKVIRDFVSADYTMKVMLDIASTLDNNGNGYVYDTIFKSCLKFSTIERVLPEEDKLKNIISYYERLKRCIKWLVNDPHFWLQYAMGHISCKNYEKAQLLIKNAYGKAKAKDNYYTDNIDTQQARLYMLMAMDASSTLEAVELFNDGHRILLKVPNSIYKYRQIRLYKKFYDEVKSNLDFNYINKILQMCNEMITSINTKNEFLEIDNESSIRNARIRELNEIINDVKQNRCDT